MWHVRCYQRLLKLDGAPRCPPNLIMRLNAGLSVGDAFLTEGGTIFGNYFWPRSTSKPILTSA